MRRRLPGLLGRFGGNVAVIANRVMRGLSHPRPPERTAGGKRFGGRTARLNFGFWILNFGLEESCARGLGRVALSFIQNPSSKIQHCTEVGGRRERRFWILDWERAARSPLEMRTPWGKWPEIILETPSTGDSVSVLPDDTKPSQPSESPILPQPGKDGRFAACPGAVRVRCCGRE